MHGVMAELDRVLQGGRRDLAGYRLDPTGTATPAPPASCDDIEPGIERGIEHGRAIGHSTFHKRAACVRIDKRNCD